MMKTTIETIGRLAKERRGDVGVREAAKGIGISPATLSRVERGNLPDLETFTKICKWLDLNSGEVLGLSPTKRSTPQVTVHFKKAQALSASTAQALGKMVVAAHRAWLTTSEEG